MEARLGGESHQLFGVGPSEVNGRGGKSLEWDLNDWNWDGDRFLASPLNASPSDCRSKQLPHVLAARGLSNNSSSCSEGTELAIVGKGKGALEKRRRAAVIGDDEPNDEVGSFSLKLGGHDYPVVEADLANWDGKNGKRSKLQGASANRSACQVEGCAADLIDAKDYHRRHKVCEMHAKASSALVANALQRFCQQCSRFHLLQEFDDGKRSCRRRLAGHNRRRRKTHPDASVSGNGLIDERASSYLLISLLRILTNLHTDDSDKSKDQDLLSHLLRNLASLAGSLDSQSLSGLLRATEDTHKGGSGAATASEALLSNGTAVQKSSGPLCGPSTVTYMNGTQNPTTPPADQSLSVAAATVEMPVNRNVRGETFVEARPPVSSKTSTVLVSGKDAVSAKPAAATTMLSSLPEMVPAGSVSKKMQLKDFDLNDTYDDTEECIRRCEQLAMPATMEAGSPTCMSWMLPDSHHSSPPQTSGNSEPTSTQSLSSSNGDAQSRTDRIIFKLFGKDPRDFPIDLRAQVFDWLSHSPTEMESYIRPGCIILTIYLRLPESEWKELCQDLSSGLHKLLQISDGDFWRSGWIYARVQHQIAFLYNGRVVLNTPLLLKSPRYLGDLCISPIAVSTASRVNFKVKGFGITQSTVRILCAFEGKYLVQETLQALVEGKNDGRECGGSQCLSFSCSLPNTSGRGFIEVEDHGLSSIFFPFLVAEEDVCSEIRMLERAIDVYSNDVHLQEQINVMNARNLAIEFLHEMGWFLRRSQLMSRVKEVGSCPSAFPLTRFWWLMSFAVDREWSAVVKKLLDLLFQGIVDLGNISPSSLLSSSDLLHSAVRKKCKSIVEVLLRYAPTSALKGTSDGNYLFRPDMPGPLNITPLHIAASSSGAENILDSLTSDPGQLGITAWRSARDSTGFTPEDYARSRGYESYLQLVQKKIYRQFDKGSVVLDISATSLATNSSQKQLDSLCSSKLSGFQIDMRKMEQIIRPACKLCAQQVIYRSPVSRSLLYRPVMLSMVGIAAVCVCVGLLLKSPPLVLYLNHPFRWESLGYGSI
ncbi:Ankyrin repeat-containing domain-containing protein [Dioscorea alata]|uniref:Ankyrin repeat-containing domain-containing protein n=1 Tax=Dioscorea alata TaxID=55571 RepID=A0ACB7V0B3_DIOAL|nr:Ankyrin repeat-containing domain-containing protein [Dioscorea alata]